MDITDTVNADGSVTRTITTTINYTAEEYQSLQDGLTSKITNIQQQLADLQTQQTTGVGNLKTSQNNLANKTQVKV